MKRSFAFNEMKQYFYYFTETEMCGGIMKTKATLAIVTLGYAIFLQLNSIYCIIWLGITLKPNVLHVTVSRCNLMLLSAIRKVSTSHGQHENKRLKFICVPKLTLIVVEFVRNKRFSIKRGFRLFLEISFEPFFRCLIFPQLLPFARWMILTKFIYSGKANKERLILD